MTDSEQSARGQGILERLREVIAGLERIGAPAKPGTRLIRVMQSMIGDDGQPIFVPASSPRFKPALEAFRDASVLRFILSQWPPAEPEEECLALARTLHKGLPTPTEESKRSVGRDAQAHLFVAALLRASGLRVGLAEPDITFVLDNEPWGIAVKRCKSSSNFVDIVRDGCNQVADQVQLGSILNGAVYVDTSQAWNPGGDTVNPMPDSVFQERYALALRRNIDAVHGSIQARMHLKHVRAVIVFDSQVRLFSERSPRFESCEVTIERQGDSRRAFLLAKRLHEVLARGWNVVKHTSH